MVNGRKVFQCKQESQRLQMVRGWDQKFRRKDWQTSRNQLKYLISGAFDLGENLIIESYGWKITIFSSSVVLKHSLIKGSYSYLTGIPVTGNRVGLQLFRFLLRKFARSSRPDSSAQRTCLVERTVRFKWITCLRQLVWQLFSMGGSGRLFRLKWFRPCESQATINRFEQGFGKYG